MVVAMWISGAADATLVSAAPLNDSSYSWDFDTDSEGWSTSCAQWNANGSMDITGACGYGNYSAYSFSWPGVMLGTGAWMSAVVTDEVTLSISLNYEAGVCEDTYPGYVVSPVSDTVYIDDSYAGCRVLAIAMLDGSYQAVNFDDVYLQLGVSPTPTPTPEATATSPFRLHLPLLLRQGG